LFSLGHDGPPASDREDTGQSPAPATPFFKHSPPISAATAGSAAVAVDVVVAATTSRRWLVASTSSTAATDNEQHPIGKALGVCSSPVPTICSTICPITFEVCWPVFYGFSVMWMWNVMTACIIVHNMIIENEWDDSIYDHGWDF
jgi:hypothetical protein